MIKNRLLLYSCLSILLSTQVLAQSEYNASSPAPKKHETRGPAKGKLLIIGGAAGDFFYEKFMDLAGGPDAPIVVIPTALTSDKLEPEDLERFRNSFIRRGFKNVSVLHTRDRKVANSEAFYEPLKSASGIWFSGGRQWRHADSYLDTKTHKAFFDLLDRGGVIAGSSAGATIQGSYLARGDTKTNTIMMGDHEEGLGFMSNVAIDQHLFARNRQFDLFEILHNKPELLGIGLDENTGILVEGDQLTVIGQSYVVMYDGTRWSAERDSVYQLPDRSYQFYLLDDGDQYDLKNRRVISD
jgi:cyanophycinase